MSSPRTRASRSSTRRSRRSSSRSSPCLKRHPEYRKAKILERIVEPERVIMFRVPWLDDKGEIQVNRGFRIEFNSAIGPYKGGLRFHPTVNLGHPQVPGLRAGLQERPHHAAHGRRQGRLGLRSQGQERQRGHALLPELHDRAASATSARTPTCPPATSAWAAARSATCSASTSALAQRVHRRAHGQGPQLGRLADPSRGHRLRRVYFAEEMLETRGDSLEGKTCLVSGSGNVAQYTVEKINQLGGKAVTLSDSNGIIHDPDGIDAEKLAFVMELKNVRAAASSEYAEKFKGATYIAEGRQGRPQPAVDHQGATCAFPSATQNEINGKDAADAA